MGFHKNLTGSDIHVIHAYTYANSTARLAATGFDASDIGKLAWQQDDNSLWMLVDDSPISWSQVNSSGSTAWGSITGTISSQTDLMTCFSGKQNTITTGTTAQYFRGDLSLATFPTNVSSFSNDAGYITGIGSFNLYDLANVGATAPSTGCVLAWSGTAWDAAPAGGSLALDNLTDVNAPTPTTNDSIRWTGTEWANYQPTLSCLTDVSLTGLASNDVLKWNGSAWVNTPMSGGSVDFGCCTQIPFMQADHLNFDYASGFKWRCNAFEVWACGAEDIDYNCYVIRAGAGGGIYDTYYRPNPSCQIFKFGFFDGETAYWGLDSAPCATTWTTNQWIRFTDYCSQWGNDGANITLSDMDNSISMSFGCGFSISGGGGPWAIGYCSAGCPTRVMINCSYYLPECGPTTGQILGYCSMTSQPEWIYGSGGSSSCGSCTWVQMSDGMGGFVANCNFIYDYTSDFLQLRHNTFSELFKIHYGASADEGWLFHSTDDTCGTGVNVTFRVGQSGMACPRSFKFDYYQDCNDWIEIHPESHFIQMHCCDGMTVDLCAKMGIDEGCQSVYFRNTCFGKFEIGNCNVDNMLWTFATYNDYIKAQDCVISYNGCCNFQWKFNNGCNTGWNEWLSSGLGQGLVISSDDGCCLCPFVFAQGLVKRAEFDGSGMFVVCADTNLAGTNLCVQGNATYSGTFDPNTISSIVVVNGLITSVT